MRVHYIEINVVYFVWVTYDIVKSLLYDKHTKSLRYSSTKNMIISIILLVVLSYVWIRFGSDVYHVRYKIFQNINLITKGVDGSITRKGNYIHNIEDVD